MDGDLIPLDYYQLGKKMGENSNTGQRIGQAAFNALYALNPGLADEVRGTENDPFYSDSKLTAFWAWLSERTTYVHG